MLFAAGDDFVLAVLAIAGVVLLTVLIIAVFFHITLMKAIQACAPRNQAMGPGLVWLGFVPFLNIVWQFVNVIQVGNSLQAEYQDRGMRCSDDSCGKTLGLTSIILGLAITAANYGGQAMVRGSGDKGAAQVFSCVLALFGLVHLILFITYWVKIAGFTRELSSSSGRSRYDDDRGYDRDERRSRYDDDRGWGPRPDAPRTIVTCPACNAKVKTSERNLGQDLWCPMCGKSFTAIQDEPPRASRADDHDDEAARPPEES